MRTVVVVRVSTKVYGLRPRMFELAAWGRLHGGCPERTCRYTDNVIMCPKVAVIRAEDGYLLAEP